MNADREKLINWIRSTYVSNPPYTYKATVDDTADAVIADYLIANGVVVREKGEWATEEEIVYCYGSFIKRRYCTGCGESPKFNRETGKYILTNFCPNCGADMKGDKKNV